ncbi:hypothetical protein F1559_001194 [Cyanidiococcus yangmingshanensis]|uniref:DNA 3'-5' helicase n=1 Tax=Cyanidiococcus yangmingshanensis TaxID=2690220 RepID=A0A7J7ID38_9RHOD|nr:hypothetical protein F1559_001194 [Cyanidiococcus yangmingshanensis]
MQTTTERFERRVAILAKRILSRPRGSTVVYVTLQRTAAAVAERLSSKYGLPAVAYHAGMSSEHREWSQDRFMTGQDEIIVATIAFGMGVDKREIRYVYHFNMSKSIETYTQGIGRAGRDGEPAICESFLCSEDIPLLESFVLSDTPSKTAIDSFLEAIFGTKNTFTTSARGPRERIRESIGPNSLGKLSGESHDIALSLYDLSRDLDVKDTTLRVMLALLDLRYGYIQEQTAFFGRCEFDLLPGKNMEDTLQMLVAEHTVSDYILRAARLLLDSLSKPGYRRNAERNMFLRIDTHEAVLTLSEKFSMPHQSSAAMHDLFFATVELLQASGVVSSVRFSKLYNVFRILRQPEDIWRVAEELHRLMIERECRELHRIRAVMALFLGTENRPIGEMAPGHGSQCLARTLCAHYNEILVHRCGICEGCLAEQGALAETMALRSLRHYSLRGSVGSHSNSAVEKDECWQRMVMELPDLLADPLLIARFAWGITSPKISMMKLKTHPLFGALQGRYSYGEILEVAEKHKTEGPS